MLCLCRPLLIQWLAISFQMARATNFKALHVLNAKYTGPANKDLGNEGCVVGFVSYFCFGQQTAYSKYTSEEHVDDTVLEWVDVAVNNWTLGEPGYLSCCPPHSKTNTADYYRCNTWTTEKNDNCHTLNLPWNDGKIKAVGAKVPQGSKPVAGQKQWVYSFPSEGEGNTWAQGLARRIKMSDLAWFWVTQAGGCGGCRGKDIEDPCYGKCINSALSTKDLVGLTETALGDIQNFPNYGIDAPDVQGIVYYGTGQPGHPSKCLELSAGDSAYSTPIDLWDCNGLVNQAWTWNGNDLNIKLAGHNDPGICIDLPGGQVYNGNPIWIWGCNGKAEQQWEWDSDTGSIRTKLNWNYCIDLPGGDTTNGNKLWLWECNGKASQTWTLFKCVDANLKPSDCDGGNSVRNRSRKVTNKTAGTGSWMHNMAKWLAKGMDDTNYTRPADWVPWYEKKAYKDWYAAQLPGPGLPRPLVPKGWNGYNTTGTVLPKVTTVLV